MKEVKESEAFSHEEYIMMNQTKSVMKKEWIFNHNDYFYDESEEIPADGLTPLESHTYKTVEEE